MCEIVPEKRGVVFRTKEPGMRPGPAVCAPHPAAAYGSVMCLPLCGISDYGLPNQKEDFFMSLYSHPFSAGYWREALQLSLIHI